MDFCYHTYLTYYKDRLRGIRKVVKTSKQKLETFERQYIKKPDREIIREIIKEQKRLDWYRQTVQEYKYKIEPLIY